MTFSSVKKAVNHEVGWILLFVRTGAIVYLCKFKVLPVLNLVKSELLNFVPTEKCFIFMGFRSDLKFSLKSIKSLACKVVFKLFQILEIKGKEEFKYAACLSDIMM